MQRRSFLTQAAVGVAALNLTHQPARAADSPNTASRPLRVSPVSQSSALPIVDTHQHLWDLKRFQLPWQKDAPKLQRSFLPADYLQATAKHNVALSVYMEVDVEVAQQNDEADYVLDLCARDDNPMAGAVISGRPADAAFPQYMARYKENAFIKGIRQVLHGDGTPAGFCLAPQFVKGIQHLGEIGKSYDLCMRSGELLDADKLVAQCPRTRFIVDHCGNMSVTDTDAGRRGKWLDGMKALAQRDNVVCKVSGIIASAAENWKPADLAPNVLDTIRIFGINRVMFAGDWPVCTLRAELGQWIDCLSEIVKDFPETDRRKLFHDNAVAFYKLPAKKWSAK
jgi:L-fuconolactonase